ncbi:hypothetical protein [Flavilitoribacter nigricans]|nr:hypothetical protein [Flavilitoribacter nigricans]
MKQSKDIFDLFRESKHKLDEAPNPQAWRRLEKRLDTRRATRGGSLYRIMAMAAGVLLLIGVFSLLPALDQNSPQEDVMALNHPPSEMEDLVVDPADSDQNIIKVVEFSRQYQDRMVQPIEEGSSAKKLVPSNQLNTRIQNADTPGDTLAKQKSEG